jgi:hypothetical protein
MAPEPVLGPGHRLFIQDPSSVPFSAVCYSIPKRRHTLRNDIKLHSGDALFCTQKVPWKASTSIFPEF